MTFAACYLINKSLRGHLIRFWRPPGKGAPPGRLKNRSPPRPKYRPAGKQVGQLMRLCGIRDFSIRSFNALEGSFILVAPGGAKGDERLIKSVQLS